MNQEIQITVNDSVFPTKRGGLHAVLLFLGCFGLQFIVYGLLAQVGVFSGNKMESYLPEIAVVSSVLLVCLYYFIRERRTGGVMQITVHFGSDCMKFVINDKNDTVAYDQICEVCKIMVIDRVHDKKGYYRLKIKCRDRGNLEFETTEQEYETHLDFEETGLFALYSACRQAGLKCC